MKKILIINGPNLNLLGKREPETYGSQSFEDYLKELRSQFGSVEINYFQSNVEGVLIDKLHAVGFDKNYLGVILNAGAYTHTSVALADAISGIETKVVEIHISNVHQREEFRHHSFISTVADGIIIGFGLKGYQLAVNSLLD